MGVNYYVSNPKTPDRFGMHIGKSSGGWCFSLRVYPEYSLTTFQHWLDFLAKLPEPCVMDGEGGFYTVAQFKRVVENRMWAHANSAFVRKYLDSGEAVMGRNGLLSVPVDGVHCVGHGEGTWDYIAVDFR